MKRITMIILAAVCVLAHASGTVAQRPADGRLSPRLINYQGYLTDTQGNPITNPSVSMTFSIYDAVSAGSMKWTETQGTVGIDRGIFNVLLGGVTPIPDSVFKAGADRWLELTVGGQTLAPRTRIVSVPYAYSASYSDTALYAMNSSPDLDWTYRITDGADTTLQAGGRWGLARPGNVAFGNADSTHVNFGVACTTGYAGDNFKYNTISGGAYNSASNRSTVGGGQYNGARGEVSTVGGGSYNVASGWTAIIAGGDHNTASNQYTFVGGGQSNTANGDYATIGGGYQNTASGFRSFVGGGYLNIANNEYATVGGGRYNKARGAYSVVNGGGGPNAVDSNLASGEGAAIGGGKCNVASGQYATVAGGLSNTASSSISTVSGGFGNVTSGGRTAIGGGFQNVASSGDAVVGGGLWNTASGYTATVCGGEGNTASGFMSTVGGGWRNTVTDSFAFIGSGHYNHNAGNYSAIMAGYADTIAATGNYSYLFGINSNLTQDSTFMVDMPHVWFGTEAAGYQLPVSRGTNGQVMVTNGSGLLSWGGITYVDSARVATNAHKLQGKDTVNFNVDYVNEGQVNSITNTMIQDAAVTMPKIAQAGATQGQVIKWNGTAWQPGADSSMDNDWTISGSNMYSAVSGNVGIGTSNPLNKLHVQNGNVVIDRPLATSILSLGTVAGVTGRIFAGDAGGGSLNSNYNQVKMTADPANTEELLRLHTGADAMSNTGTAALYFGQFNLADMAAVKAVNEGGQPLNRTAGLSFWTEPAGTGVPLQERMRIAGNGNIGIGTTAPAEKLDVAGTVRLTGFKMPTSATNGYVLTSDASGAGTWQSIPADIDWSFRVTDGNDTSLVTGSCWGIARAGNTMYGNADSTHVNLGVASTTGTNGQNYKYSTVAGGGNNTATGDNATVGGGYLNNATAWGSVVAGGYGNTASITYSTIGGGFNNNAGGTYSTVGGGCSNVASGQNGAVGGGSNNTSNGWGALISGGYWNTVTGSGTTVAGGQYNTINGDNSAIGGGYMNSISSINSTISGGYADTIFTGAAYSYLFGINSNLTQDSTFMVDLPHVRFGKESGGYEFPTSDGTNGQALVTNGSGLVSWGTPTDADWTIAGNNMYSAVSGNVGIGTSSPAVRFEVRAGTSDTAAIFRGNLVIQSKATGNAVLELGEGLDYAEGFDVTRPDRIKPGTVLIIDPASPGKLAVSHKAYDTKVAGIVAGGNGLSSGVRLGTADFDHNVALAGRVYCNVDASMAAIEPGDLLTTADMPGYAMKALNYDRAKGAVLGKAMERLGKGQKGQILVLVSLQ